MGVVIGGANRVDFQDGPGAFRAENAVGDFMNRAVAARGRYTREPAFYRVDRKLFTVSRPQRRLKNGSWPEHIAQSLKTGFGPVPAGARIEDYANVLLQRQFDPPQREPR